MVFTSMESSVFQKKIYPELDKLDDEINYKKDYYYLFLIDWGNILIIKKKILLKLDVMINTDGIYT